MFNFFVLEENRSGNRFSITGGDFNHIKNVLRMQVGDTCLVSCGGQSDLCQIDSFFEDAVCLEIIEENYNVLSTRVRKTEEDLDYLYVYD